MKTINKWSRIMKNNCQHENETLINEDVFLTLDDKQDTKTILTFRCDKCRKVGYKEWITPSDIQWNSEKQ